MPAFSVSPYKYEIYLALNDNYIRLERIFTLCKHLPIENYNYIKCCRENHTLMKDLSFYTRVDPSERIRRYNSFMDRIQTTERVNMFILILKLFYYFFIINF